MTTPDEICSRTDHTEGYYEFVFHIPDRRAVGILFDHLQTLNDLHHQAGQPSLRIMLNFSNGITPPLRQVGIQVQQFRTHNPDRVHPRLVILYANSLMQMTSDVFVRTFTSRMTQVRLFPPARREEAVEWLLKE